MLKLSHVKKEYHHTVILDIPSMELETGSYWLKGSNGSGKSTFMKMVGGMIPFEGKIQINAIDLKEKPTEYRRLVNYVEAEPLYPPFLSGLDLVNFTSTTRDADKAAVEKLIQAFGIQTYYKNPVSTYSSGMVKKLSLVMAFIGQPRLILLDEPLVTLDKNALEIVYELVNDSFKRGVSFIFTSHQAMEYSNLPATRECIVQDHTICFL